jgi:kynurenine formamidase
MTDCAKWSRRTLLRALPVAALAVTSLSAFAAAPRRIIDLSHPITPGENDFKLERVMTFEKNRANMNRWTLNEHSGTHLDAPLHFTGGGMSLADIKAEDLVAPLAVIDITTRAALDPGTAVTVDDIKAWETKHGRLPNGCCVAMYAGWGKLYGTDKYEGRDASGKEHAPGFHIDTARFLMSERKVKGLGVDSQSIDPEPHGDGYPVHRLWLPSGRWAAEGLTNLDRVPASGATIVIGALKVVGGSGGPARILALV